MLTIDTRGCQGSETEVNYLEHVQAVISLNSSRRGDVEMFLTSPMGNKYNIILFFVQDFVLKNLTKSFFFFFSNLDL